MVAVAVAVQYQFDKVMIAVAYLVDTAAGELRQVASVSEQAYEVWRWEVVKVEPQPESELPVPVPTRSPCGKVWATGSGWGMVIDLRPQ